LENESSSCRKYYDERYGQMKAERDSFIPHWRDLSDHILPRQARFLVTDRNRGDRRNNKIIDNTATLSARTIMSGMMSGMTSPARPWFVLRTPDHRLNEYQPVKLWLDTTRNRMAEVFLRSNLYTTLPLVYGDLAVYGTSAFLALEDDEDMIRFYHLSIGSYCLANSARGRVDTCYREFQMTVRQMFQMFGKENCSKAVQSLDQPGTLETWVTIIHAIEPNPDYEPRRQKFSQYKAYRSCYYEAGGNEDKMLRTSGFDRFRVLAPRWTVTGEDVYGSSPGMEALGDIRALQLQQKRKQQLVDKSVNPPMGAPAALRNDRASVLPGDVTYYDNTTGNQKFEPLYMVDGRGYQWLLQDIAETQNRIKRTFFEDLFLMLANDQRSGITAREIAERHEEKLLMLGPVVERQNDEMLDPLVDITFETMLRYGVLPTPPPELQGKPLAVEYISIMAQAMKTVGVASIERFVSFVGQLAGAKPEVLDKVNFDEAVDEYLSTVGAPPKLIYDAKYVEQVRAHRQKQQQAAQLAASGAQAASAAKTLSEAKVGNENALTQMLRNMKGAAAG